MIARVSKALNKKEGDKGFTLVELLVVVIIIGILAAIAIPLYLGQQEKARVSALKTDLHNGLTASAALLTENPSATAAQLQTAAQAAASEGTTLTVTYTAASNTLSIAGTKTGVTGTFTIDQTGKITEPTATP